jgi:uncharacterized repeat protein (TIGR03803 family)
MKPSPFSRFALSVCVAVVMLAGCGGSQPPVGAPGAMPQAPSRTSSSYQMLHSFGYGTDGAKPVADLIDVKGTLYGTTREGGKYGDGTVFSITTSGTEHVLHNFAGDPDGQYPLASLVDVNGTLYGTTSQGGTHSCASYTGCGTVFSISTKGKEHVLYSFAGEPDGQYPFASLIDVKGTLYGTTAIGGENGTGTVFSVSKTGTEHVLHSFGGSSDNDGIAPEARLIDVKGTLYGTTEFGGTNCKSKSSSGCGTFFRITTSGTEHVLHDFGGAYDGAFPVAGLIDVKGTLYGTTGAGTGHAYENGTIFTTNTAGAEHVFYSFGGGNGPAFPEAGVIDVKGTLYGTTITGGEYSGGIAFSVTSSAMEQVLHYFGGGSDGSQPKAGLIDVKGTLYGATGSGGKYGDGTVFALSP